MPRKNSNNLPQTYATWLSELKKRYAQSQIKASIAINGELIGFYYSLGRDIQQKQFQNTYGSGFYKNSAKICAVKFQMPRFFRQRLVDDL